MEDDEILFLKSLPKNNPDTLLTDYQLKKIDDLYKKYLGHHSTDDLLDMMNGTEWGKDGPSLKKHEAQRLMLRMLYK